MKKKLLALIVPLALLASFFYVAPVSDVRAQENWVISGDKVFIDDSNAYLSAAPHTIGSSGWVEFELQSKNFSGDIDAVWSFNLADGVKPTKPQIWAGNVAHEVYEWIEVDQISDYTFYNTISFTPLYWESNTPDIGNTNNIYLADVTYFTMGEYVTHTVAYDSYYVIGGSYVMSLHHTEWEKEYYTEYYDDWTPFLQDIRVISRDLAGMDTWYVVSGATIQAGVTYKVRVWVEVPFSGLEQSAGKYAWGVKPSFETIAEANANGHLYLLDPWWDASWSYKRKLTFTNGAQAENLTSFPVLFHFADPTIDFDKIKADGADIRFVDDDDSTPIDYEIEEWDDIGEEAWVWVEVPQINASDNTDFIYIYYGNAAATDAQDAASVWSENYISVWHLAEAAGNAVDSADGNDGVVDGATQGAAGQIFDAFSFDGDNDKVVVSDNANLSSLGAVTIEAWIKGDAAEVTGGIVSKDDGAGGNREWMFYIGNAGRIRFALYSAAVANRLTTTGDTDRADGAWHYVTASWDGVNDAGHIIICVDSAVEGLDDDTKTGTGYVAHDTATPVEIGRYYGAVAGCFKGIIDEGRISTGVRSDKWIAAQYLSMTDAFITVGGEESGGVVAPTVVTNAASSVEDTTATVSGNITATGGDNCTTRGFQWDIDAGVPYADNWTENGNYGICNFTHGLTSLPTGTVIHYRAGANNTAGWGWGGELTFLTKPAAPTNVAATDGAHTDKVVVTWTKSTGATGYKVYEGVNLLDTLGDVATFDDNTAAAGSITHAGNVTASDGASSAYVILSSANEATANGAARTYKVKALNGTGDSDDSATDNGYRGVGAITYQWQMSDADADANYNTNIGTTDPYNATEAPAFPAARYFQCVVSSVDASNTPQTSDNDRGFRGAPPAPPPPLEDPSDPDKVYLELRPDLDETGMIKKNFVPTETYVGIFFGYSLPLWTDKTANETMYFEICVPNRWDGSSDILVHTVVATTSNQTGNVYELELAWDKVSPNIVEAIPTGAPNLVSANRTVGSELTYACYLDWFILDYDVEADDPVAVDDNIAFRFRRFGGSDNLTSELIVIECSVLFARGDLLGDPDADIGDIVGDIINNFIEDGTLIGGEQVEALAAVLGEWTPAILLFVFLLPLIFFSLLAFWRYGTLSGALLFMLAGGVGIITGFYWYDIYTTNLGLTTGLMLIAYGIVCIGFGFRGIFWRNESNEKQ